jgi:hypothetical protein
MSNTYFMRFGSGDPRQYSGISPTFLIFRQLDGSNVSPPPIAQVGLSSGIYGFTFGVTMPITFLADAATTSPGTAGRYVTGDLDPKDSIDYTGQTLMALGTTSVAYGLANYDLGTTVMALGSTGVALGATILSVVQSISLFQLELNIGSTTSSYGDNTTDPDTVFGYLKRLQEIMEGNASYGRNSNAWSMYSRGSSTLLRTKNIGTDAVGVTRS